MYPYITPHGYGDTFFIYAVNGEDIPFSLLPPGDPLPVTVQLVFDGVRRIKTK